MKNILPKGDEQDFLKILEKRFFEKSHRHENLKWETVSAILEKNKSALFIISEMENSGGEPDAFVFENNELCYVDFAKESPKQRRSLCYDDEALQARKKFPPENSAMQLAVEIGIEVINEEEYHQIQKVEILDTKTSSWLKSPVEIREKGGAIFGDFRFGRVFIYHNGADSYYAARGFRGKLKL